MQYLYNDGSLYTFMDNASFEQFSIAKADLEDVIPYLKEGLEVAVSVHNEQPIAVSLPQKIEYTITYTEDATKGDTASGNVLKEAELDNGLKVKVPAFLITGQRILVNTESGAYVERVN
jgi:elongation factor P